MLLQHQTSPQMSRGRGRYSPAASEYCPKKISNPGLRTGRMYMIDPETDDEDRPQTSQQPGRPNTTRIGYAHTQIEQPDNTAVVQMSLMSAVGKFGKDSSKWRQSKAVDNQYNTVGIVKAKTVGQTTKHQSSDPVQQVENLGKMPADHKESFKRHPVAVSPVESRSVDLQQMKPCHTNQYQATFENRPRSKHQPHSYKQVLFRHRHPYEVEESDEENFKPQVQPVQPPAPSHQQQSMIAEQIPGLDGFPLGVVQVFRDLSAEKHLKWAKFSRQSGSSRSEHPSPDTHKSVKPRPGRMSPRHGLSLTGGYRGRVPKMRPPRTTFMSLPGEIRNIIYGLLIPESRVLVQTTQPNKDYARAKAKDDASWAEPLEKAVRGRTRLFHTLDNDQIREGFSLTQGLLLTNCQIKEDVELFLYTRTTFCFSSLNVLNRFLRQASQMGVRAIRKIEISQYAYGNARLTEFQVYNHRYHEKWRQTCINIGQTLLSLQSLKLNASVSLWPVDFTSIQKSDWWQSCLLMVPHEKLPHVKVRFRHPMIKEHKKLPGEIACRLEDDLMDAVGQAVRNREKKDQALARKLAKAEAEEAQRLTEAERERAEQRMSKPLVIAMADIQKWKLSAASKGGSIKSEHPIAASSAWKAAASLLC